MSMETQEAVQEAPEKKIRGFWPWYGIVLILCLLLCAGIHVILPDSPFSETEKRVLKSFPALSASALSDGTYPEQLENYLADQFPGRTSFMQLRMRFEYLLFRRESNGVYYGKDDYLIEQFIEDPERTEKTLDSMQAFILRHPETEAYFMLVPTKADLLRDKMPDYADTEDQDAFIDRCFTALSGAAKRIDPRPALKTALKNGVQVYYRSDHHWTADGAYAALPAADYAMGFFPKPYSRAVVYNRFTGSLSAKSGWQLPLYDSIVLYTPAEASFSYFIRDEGSGENNLSAYHPEALSGDDPYEFYFGGNVPMLTVETDADTEKTLLVFKDSYANCFLPFLFGHYRKIVIIDPRYYEYRADSLFLTDDFDQVLFLYNAGTFAEDTSLVKILEP